jgi:RNA polymerase sigma factor (sigma-70 family)
MFAPRLAIRIENRFCQRGGDAMAMAKRRLDPEEKEGLVAKYLPMVKKIAMGLARRSTDPIEDLIQVGSIGLLEAIDRFEEGHNAEFKTYAVHLITGHIRHYLRDRQNLLRGPRVLQELSYRLNLVFARFLQDEGREPTHFELAELLKITPAQVDEVRIYDRRVTVLWLDQEINEGEEDEHSLLQNLSDPRSGLGDFDALDERLLLGEAIEKLPGQQKTLLMMRYFQDLTQVEIALELGISQMEVCRRLKQAEKSLKSLLTHRK